MARTKYKSKNRGKQRINTRKGRKRVQRKTRIKINVSEKRVRTSRRVKSNGKRLKYNKSKKMVGGADKCRYPKKRKIVLGISADQSEEYSFFIKYYHSKKKEFKGIFKVKQVPTMEDEYITFKGEKIELRTEEQKELFDSQIFEVEYKTPMEKCAIDDDKTTLRIKNEKGEEQPIIVSFFTIIQRLFNEKKKLFYPEKLENIFKEAEELYEELNLPEADRPQMASYSRKRSLPPNLKGRTKISLEVFKIINIESLINYSLDDIFQKIPTHPLQNHSSYFKEDLQLNNFVQPLRYPNKFWSSYFTVPVQGQDKMFYNADMLFTDDNDFPTYIAAQCPGSKREDTPVARKQMFDLIKATQPKFVIMVTNVKEQDKYKCTKYFTEYFEEISDFSQTEQKDGLDIRKALNDKGINGIYHLHYRNWPDHGVPPQSAIGELTKMVEIAVKYLDGENSTKHSPIYDATQGIKKVSFFQTDKRPIMIHCSAGVGRTGALIMMIELKRLYDKFKTGPIKSDRYPFLNELNFGDHSNNIVIVTKLLIYLRIFRPNLVQTVEQFMFIIDYVKGLLEEQFNGFEVFNVTTAESKTDEGTGVEDIFSDIMERGTAESHLKELGDYTIQDITDEDARTQILTAEPGDYYIRKSEQGYEGTLVIRGGDEDSLSRYDIKKFGNQYLIHLDKEVYVFGETLDKLIANFIVKTGLTLGKQLKITKPTETFDGFSVIDNHIIQDITDEDARTQILTAGAGNYYIRKPISPGPGEIGTLVIHDGNEDSLLEYDIRKSGDQFTVQTNDSYLSNVTSNTLDDLINEINEIIKKKYPPLMLIKELIITKHTGKTKNVYENSNDIPNPGPIYAMPADQKTYDTMQFGKISITVNTDNEIKEELKIILKKNKERQQFFIYKEGENYVIYFSFPESDKLLRMEFKESELKEFLKKNYNQTTGLMCNEKVGDFCTGIGGLKFVNALSPHAPLPEFIGGHEIQNITDEQAKPKISTAKPGDYYIRESKSEQGYKGILKIKSVNEDGAVKLLKYRIQINKKGNLFIAFENFYTEGSDLDELIATFKTKMEEMYTYFTLGKQLIIPKQTETSEVYESSDSDSESDDDKEYGYALGLIDFDMAHTKSISEKYELKKGEYHVTLIVELNKIKKYTYTINLDGTNIPIRSSMISKDLIIKKLSKDKETLKGVKLRQIIPEDIVSGIPDKYIVTFEEGNKRLKNTNCKKPNSKYHFITDEAGKYTLHYMKDIVFTSTELESKEIFIDYKKQIETLIPDVIHEHHNVAVNQDCSSSFIK